MQRSANEFAITTGRDGSRSFGDHDDRWAPRGRGNNRRKFNNKSWSRGSYRGRGQGGGYKNQAGGPVDTEGDVMMGGDAEHAHGSQPRFNPYGGRPKSRRGKRGDQYHRYPRDNSQRGGAGGKPSTRPLLPSSHSHPGSKTWYKVSIPHAKETDKATLLTLLGNHAPGNFRPIQFGYKGEMAVFYLDDRDVANLMRGVSRRITLPGSNFKLIINVNMSSPPFPVMNEENLDKLKVVMSARYDPSIKTLDLTSLYEDRALQQEGLYLPLNRPVIATCVAKIIQQNIPELVGLNLSSNRMLSLSSVQEMVQRAPNVVSLDLSKNQLRAVEELDKLKGWQLTELVLDKNPLCDRIHGQTEYVSAVRKRFPKVVKLDGKELPPPITFDVSTAVVPVSQGSYFVNAEVQELVVRFLKEYYTIYDCDNRQPLIDAYHDNAIFSLSVASNPAIENKQPSLADYLSISRNDLRIRGRDERDKGRIKDRLLKKGKLQVVSELSTLPRTTHDANSFVVDVNLVSSTVLSFVVNGLFKESDNKADKPPIRAFSRCFTAVPAAGGVLVTNDCLTITNASPQQQRAAFKSTGPTPSSSPVSSNPPVPGTSAVPSPVPVPSPLPESSPQQQLDSLPPQRQQMVLAFCQESNMNPIYSFRCLEDNAWDYVKAGQMFLNLQAEGKVPPEAFAK
ncbi:nuclear RNA export factor 1-like [Littorina saxatilis]|uniref:Nuclear RNA export factor 1 n=1 Tax=Littorina saxatilis TaxID=31220 RepID=A0AAN9GCB9_9CAEN